MKFILTLVVVGLLVFFSYYMFVAEEFKGSPKTQVKQALGIKEKEDPAIEMEVNEIAIKFGLSHDERDTNYRQLVKMELESKKQKTITVLNDNKLTEQQKNGKITLIQKQSYNRIASYFGNSKEDRQEIVKWLMSRQPKVDSNSH